MLNALFARLGLRHADTTSTPVFDGVLRPNQELDLCRLIGRELGAVDDVAVIDGSIPVISAGHGIVALTGHWFAPRWQTVATLGGRCGALAALDDGGLACAVDGMGIVIAGGRHDGRSFETVAGRALSCVTAIAASGDRLVVSEGSATDGAQAWRRDLFQQNRTGRVVEIDLVSGSAGIIADGLGWAGGVALSPDGGVIVSETWKHTVRTLPANGRPALSYENIPAYAGRIVAAESGGFWLSCFAVRTQLTDFVLADRKLSDRMIREVAEPYWIAPSLAASDHPFEPTQIGGIKQYGAKKPWAPPRSYGLVIRLDDELSPTASLHSRVDGKRHGITGLARSGGRVFIVSKGNGKLMAHDEAAA